jgi:hypothetical protein
MGPWVWQPNGVPAEHMQLVNRLQASVTASVPGADGRIPYLSVLDTSDGMRVWHVRELCSAVEDAASQHVGRSARQL